MVKPTEKIINESQAKCPWCSKLIRAKLIRTTTKPGVKAESFINEILEKDTQTTLGSLEDDFKASKKKQKKAVDDPYSPPRVKK